jgi:hypothetical protein
VGQLLLGLTHSPARLGRDDVPRLGSVLPFGASAVEQLHGFARHGLEERLTSPPPLAERPLVGLADHHHPGQGLVEVVAVHRRRYHGQRLGKRPADPRRSATRHTRELYHFLLSFCEAHQLISLASLYFQMLGVKHSIATATLYIIIARLTSCAIFARFRLRFLPSPTPHPPPPRCTSLSKRTARNAQCTCDTAARPFPFLKREPLMVQANIHQRRNKS